MSTENPQKSFYKLLITLAKNEKERNEVLSVLGIYFKDIFVEYEEVDYPEIYRTVRDTELSIEDIELLLQLLVVVEEQVSTEGHKKVAKKMRRHFQLSYEQKISFNRLDQKFNKDLKKSEAELMTLQSKMSNMDSELTDAYIILNTIEGESSKIYAQFITILGIFTAIVVSVFGGLSIVSGVFEKINETPIWKVTLIGSLVSIFVLCLLFLLTRWISTIVQKAFGHENERSLMQIITNNGAFAIGIFIFCYLIIASVIFSSNATREKLTELINVWEAFPIFLLLLFPIVVGIGVFIKAVDLRKY